MGRSCFHPTRIFERLRRRQGDEGDDPGHASGERPGLRRTREGEQQGESKVEWLCAVLRGALALEP